MTGKMNVAPLLVALRLSSEQWCGAHRAEVYGRPHAHIVRESFVGGLVLFVHVTGKPSRFIRVVITDRMLATAVVSPRVLMTVATMSSHALHRSYYRSGVGCLVCSPWETARMICALHHRRRDQEPVEGEEAPYVYAATLRCAGGNAVAVADILASDLAARYGESALRGQVR